MITLDKDERVLFRIYKDWVALAIRSIVYILLGIAPLALYILFRTFYGRSIRSCTITAPRWHKVNKFNYIFCCRCNFLLFLFFSFHIVFILIAS